MTNFSQVRVIGCQLHLPTRIHMLFGKGKYWITQLLIYSSKAEKQA